MGIARLRIGVVGVMGCVIALAAGTIFDRVIWALCIAAATPALVALATAAQGRIVRLVGAAFAVAGSTFALVLVAGGDLGDGFTAFTDGPQRLLSTDWPSPDRADLIGTIGVGVAIAVALAAELARRSRLHLAPLLPLAVAHVGVIAMSSPGGVGLEWLLPLGVQALFLAALRPGPPLRERLSVLSGERRILPLASIAFALAAALALPVGFDRRSDPRRNDPPESSAALLDPIEATLALQEIDPPIDLHEITLVDPSGRRPIRFRTAALIDYDGRRWEPELTLRPIGRRLGPDTADAADMTVEFLDDDLQLVPLPGSPIVVEAAIETDPLRTLVRLVDRPTDGDTFRVTTRIEPGAGEVAPGSIGTRAVDENVSGLAELAEAIIADTAEPPVDVLGELRAIEQTMHDDFVLDPDAPGGGLQRALIDRFLRDTQRGNAEQFATAFVLLARSIGVDARIATGFEIDPDRLVSDGERFSFTLTSADAAIWPEVRSADGWLAFEPAPEEPVSGTTPPPPEPQLQTPAAPQPPIAPPPESSEDPVVTETVDDAASATSLPAVVLWAARVGAGLALLVVPLLLVAGAILGVKRRRRRRRLGGPPESRIRGAWSVATNRLVDAGLVIHSAATNGEIAADGAEMVRSADRELHRLATLASAATFGSPTRPDLLAEDAAACLGQVESSMAASRSRWQRLRWQLSLRSLRRSTSSPV